MGRSLKPQTKRSRRLGVFIGGNFDAFNKRTFPPGQHGPTMRRKVSDYAAHLHEKQKLQYLYGGLREQQFRRYVHEAKRRGGNTAVVLLQLLETRLDNVLYRLGFARTRLQARQLVVHNHVRVNGKKVTAPMYPVSEGDEIQVKEKSRKVAVIEANMERAESLIVPDWLDLDRANCKGRVVKMPHEVQLEIPVNIQYIVEFYSR